MASGRETLSRKSSPKMTASRSTSFRLSTFGRITRHNYAHTCATHIPTLVFAHAERPLSLSPRAQLVVCRAAGDATGTLHRHRETKNSGRRNLTLPGKIGGSTNDTFTTMRIAMCCCNRGTLAAEFRSALKHTKPELYCTWPLRLRFAIGSRSIRQMPLLNCAIARRNRR